MNDLYLRNGEHVDNLANVLEEIRKLSNVGISSPDTILRFVNSEKATRFYFDSNLGSSMVPQKNTEYLWVDTGLQSFDDYPIFISMKKVKDGFRGHITGDARSLFRRVLENRRSVSPDAFFWRFIEKYRQKTSDREFNHIEDEQSYLMKRVGGTETVGSGIMAKIISGLDIDFVQEESVNTFTEEAEMSVQTPDTAYAGFSAAEEDITISLLFDKLENAYELIREQQATIEAMGRNNEEYKDRIEQLSRKNKQYEEDFVRFRQAVYEERDCEKSENGESGNSGHKLLGHGKKILVLGDTQIGAETMKAIARNFYAFDKDDFEFETDYGKVVRESGNIRRGGRFRAVIIGAVPHKVVGLGKSTCLIEKLRGFGDDGLFMADARVYGGDLKITKESYKNALEKVCKYLQENAA